MTFLKIALMVLGVVPIVVLLFFAWLFCRYQVLYPWKFKQLEKEAATWNSEHWEKGEAFEVTVEASSNEQLGNETHSTTLICYEKKFAYAGGLRRQPYSHKQVRSHGATDLSVPFGAEAEMVFSLHHLCNQVPSKHKTWVLPHLVDPGSFKAEIVSNDGMFQCQLGHDPQTTIGEVTRPRIVAINKVPMKDLMSKEQYLALLNQERNARPLKQAPSFSWREVGQKKCWSYNGVACAPQLEAICGRPLR